MLTFDSRAPVRSFLMLPMRGQITSSAYEQSVCVCVCVSPRVHTLVKMISHLSFLLLLTSHFDSSFHAFILKSVVTFYCTLWLRCSNSRYLVWVFFWVVFFPLHAGSNWIKPENSFHFLDNRATVAERVLGSSEKLRTCEAGWMNSSSWRTCRVIYKRKAFQEKISPKKTTFWRRKYPLAIVHHAWWVCDDVDRGSLCGSVSSTSNWTPPACILLNLQTIDLGCHFLLSFITMATAAAAAAGCRWSLEGLPRETEVGDTKGNGGTEGVDE